MLPYLLPEFILIYIQFGLQCIHEFLLYKFNQQYISISDNYGPQNSSFN